MGAALCRAIGARRAQGRNVHLARRRRRPGGRCIDIFFLTVSVLRCCVSLSHLSWLRLAQTQIVQRRNMGGHGAAAPATGWEAEVRKVLKEDWQVRPSGGLVLGWPKWVGLEAAAHGPRRRRRKKMLRTRRVLTPTGLAIATYHPSTVFTGGLRHPGLLHHALPLLQALHGRQEGGAARYVQRKIEARRYATR